MDGIIDLKEENTDFPCITENEAITEIGEGRACVEVEDGGISGVSSSQDGGIAGDHENSHSDHEGSS